jgi:ABC-type glycerol-3-phosphate transport system permease component
VIIVYLWKNAGYSAIIYLAGLQSIPAELYDAGKVDGATGWQRFRHITLPQLSPTTFFIAVTTIIFSIQAFDIIAVMTEGGPVNATTTLIWYLYQQGFRAFRAGLAGRRRHAPLLPPARDHADPGVRRAASSALQLKGVGVELTLRKTAAKATQRPAWRRYGPPVVKYALLLLVGVVFAVPLFWMASASLKDLREIYTFPARSGSPPTRAGGTTRTPGTPRRSGAST